MQMHMKRFSKKETIRFGGKTAHSFGIIDSIPKSRNAFYDIEVEKIYENDKQVELFLKVKDDNEKEFKKEVIISKATISKKESTIIGWCYITLIGEDENFKSKAKYFLELATKNEDNFLDEEEIKSALPYYLLSKNKLYEGEAYILRQLYKASKCKDIFHDFYWELFRHENDKIRKVNIAKRALKDFPKADNEFFIDFVVNDLFKKGRLKEARKFLDEQLQKISKKDWGNGFPHLKVTAINLFTAQKDFIQAEKMLSGAIFNKSTDSVLRGKFYFEKGDYTKAIKFFTEAIAFATRDTDDTQVSYWYLLASYTKTKNLPEIEDIIENAKLCHQEMTVFFPLEFSYDDFAEQTLRSILKLKIEELLKGKIKGLLAYIQVQSLPVPEDETPRRILTQKEKKILTEAEITIKEALSYFPQDKLFNAVYSNILFFKKEYDNSLIYKLRAMEGLESSITFLSLQVKMSDASDSFLERYTDIVRDAVKSYGVSVEDYIEHQFNEDAGDLYEKKKFTTIKELYTYLKPNINNLASLGKNNYYGMWDVGLFEVAYALTECGEKREAKAVYEAYLENKPTSSSALNNLALIYEEEGNLKKAQELIKKAKENVENDDTVERNYDRILSEKRQDISATQSKQKVQNNKKKSENTSQTIIENSTGYLLLNGGKIEVGPAKNIPFKLLEALCPFGTVKAINAIFNTSSTDRSKFRSDTQISLPQKQDILRTRIKELQEILRKNSKNKIKVSLGFNESAETVFLKQTPRG